MYYECELDENGTLVDEDCENRFDYTFNQYNSAGLWNLTYLKYVNDTLTETINGSVHIEPDIHDDQQPVKVEEETASASKFDDKQIMAISVAAISLLAIVILALSMAKGKNQEE